jgi:type II secretory pathway pseudopilin PulG
MQHCAYCGSPVDAVSYAPCTTCGNPTNGAPRPQPQAGGGANVALIVVGVAIGGLFLIAILGILSAIAIPNFITATQRAKQKRTMADMRSIAVTVETYATEHNEYPRSLDVITGKTPTVDGWGFSYEYQCLIDGEGKCSGYVIGSGAKDGRYERGGLFETATQPHGATSNFDCDILFSNGTFVEYPEGVRR